MADSLRFIGSSVALLLLCVCGRPDAVAGSPPSAAKDTDALAERKKFWLAQLEMTKFRFDDDRTGLFYSLSQSDLDCQVHIIYDQRRWGGLTLKFMRDGKEMLSLAGHPASEFRVFKGVLYLAHFDDFDTGCSVSAYDLTTGKVIWKTRLRAVGDLFMHSIYYNQVSLRLGSEEQGTVHVVGREAFGDYVEILDRKTGQVLAHKVYRTDFDRPK